MSVNVYTEWGKLKEIIVGNCLDATDYNLDVSFRVFFNQNIKDPLLKNSIGLKKKLVEQRQEDLDGIASLLSKAGIQVKRPARLKEVKSFRTPEFEDHLSAADNPRDQVLIVGDEIIETSCQWRRRYFENDLLKDVFMEYFRNGARWTLAPRPRMTLNSFDLSTMDRKNPHIDWASYEGNPDRFEIMFDAAQCLKFGKDIVMNVSTQNHLLGAQWLARHLEGRFRLHVVRITDHHIDGMFMPLKPGVLLINPLSMGPKVHLLPEPLQSWDRLIVPEEHREDYSVDDVLLASTNINVNVLPLNEKDVLVFDQEGTAYTPLVRTLERHGFHPVPVRLRHSRLFGGGLHCVTLDTVREESQEDYFS